MILENQHDLPAFRRAIRQWLDDVVPAGWAERLARGSDDEFRQLQLWWMAERNKVGLAVPHWPKQYGGAGLSLTHQIVLAEEIARAGAPSTQMFVIALNHIPATLIPYGTEEQRRKYLPGIPQGDVWCQGFSEPGAGSDLASLRCKAVRQGDHYVINGQKIWSSHSMYARYCILLARTDFNVSKHAGISFFLLDMHSPGVVVRPIRQANGRAEFGELFLTDVKIPVENLVGAENEGWKVTQATLAAERGVLAFEGAERQRYTIENYYSRALREDASWLQDDQLRREFMQLFAEMQAGRRLIRQLLKENEGTASSASMTPAFVKLTGTALRKRVGSLMVKIAAIDGQRFETGVEETAENPMYEYISSFGGAIAAGSNEIMRNIIAERGLGMPRDS
jgi:alkylation response protein AidB-like acyl-CoA dehydrogenase